MKRSLRRHCTSIVAALFLSAPAFAAEKAPVQFTSYSVLIYPAQAEDPLTGLEYTMGLSSVGDEHAINSELMLATQDHGFSHESFFVLEDPFSPEPAIFGIVLDIPPFEDANENGIEDFYDISAEVNSIETVGLHPNSQGQPEEFYATWVRAAGEAVGSVYLNFPYLGVQFGHEFQLVHYSGEFTFNRTGTNLQGTLALTNRTNPDDRILGPLTVQVVNENTLKLSANTWNNGAGLDYVAATNIYDGRISTNFFSYWLMEDGFPANAVTDYVDWMMVISSEDANGNGVLDLVESSGTPPERPSLSITKTSTGFEIRITGSGGKTYWLERTAQVTAAAWPDHDVVTMTGPVQTITVPASEAGNTFFRLREI